MTDCDIEQAVILAGGRGSRLGSITNKIPKPLLPINGSPFLGYLLEQLADQGCKQVLVLVGYMADQIKEYCDDGGRWGINVKCVESPVEAETGQRLKDALPLLDQHFLLMYCDNYWPLNLADLYKAFVSEPDAPILTVYSNLDDYTRNNVLVDATGHVTKYDATRSSRDLNGVEVGYSIIPRQVLSNLSPENVSFSHSVYPKLASRGLLRSYLTNHRYYSIGSLERLSLTEAFLKPQKAVILDRDGTLNVKPPRAQYVTSWQQFNWLPGAITSLQLLKREGYKLILASNQPGIARGVMTESDLAGIHNAMAKDLEQHNVQLDAIYYCPHGWDEGCFCRKPSPGMLFEAQRDFHLDLTKTLFIGDDPRDKQAGQSARCLTATVSENNPLIRVVQEFLSSQSL